LLQALRFFGGNAGGNRPVPDVCRSDSCASASFAERGTETLMAKCQYESLVGTERRMEEVCELENCK